MFLINRVKMNLDGKNLLLKIRTKYIECIVNIFLSINSNNVFKHKISIQVRYLLNIKELILHYLRVMR